MRYSYRVVLLTLLVLFMCRILLAQNYSVHDSTGGITLVWMQAAGPYGGDVRSIAVDNQGNVFAATNGNGVYRSSDDGNTWTQVANGLNNLRIQSLVSGFGFILAGTDGGGIFISYDQGEHWKQTNNGLSNLGIGALLVDLKGIIYAGSLSDFGCTGVYRSLDTAKSWLQTGLQNGCIRSLAASPENTIFAAGDNGIYRSTDDGITWVSVSNFGSRSIAVNENGKIYAARFGGLNYSSDNGNTWLPTGLTEGNIIAVAVKKFGYVFAGRWGDGVLTSTNNGTTWNHWSEGLSRIYCIYPSTSKNIFAGTMGNGVCRSTDYGQTWSKASDGMNAIFSYTVTTNINDDVIVGTYGAGIFRSLDRGETWTRTWIGYSLGDVCNVLRRGPDGSIYACTNTGLLRSMDNGNSWVSLNAPGLPYAVGWGKIGELFCGGWGTAYKSTDNGGTWSQILSFGTGYARGIVVDSNDNILVATESGTYRSTNHGSSWNLTGGGNAQYLLVDNQNNIFVAGDGFINRSQDGGQSWKQVLSKSIVGMAIYGEVIFASGDGVYISTNGGDTWYQSNNGLKNTFIYSVAADQRGYVYGASPGGGVYRTTKAITKVTEQTEIVATFSLSQNYPNPFNSTTIIQYNLPNETHVKIIVFDVLGRQVRTIVDEDKSRGTYEIQFDANNLSSGIYFCRLQTSEFTQTKKLVLMR